MTDSAWWEIGEASEVPARSERELVPEGTHRFTVKAASETVGELEIRLALDDRYGWVFCRLPKGRDWARRLAAEFADAVGVGSRDWSRAIANGELVGRTVEARVYHRLADGGRTFVNVAKFIRDHDGPAVVERAVAPPAGRAPTRRPPTKAQAADRAGTTPDDDIPF